MSRWEELTKQPTAKFIHIYNQTDEYDNKGKRILISPRRTPDFDHFVDRNESNTSRALGTGGKLDRVGLSTEKKV